MPKTHAPFTLHWKYRHQVGVVERDVQLAVDGRAVRFDVRDVEQMPVRAAGEPCTEPCAYRRMRAVAAREIPGAACFLAAVGVQEPREDVVAPIVETVERAGTLDRNADGRKTLAQQALVLVLREDQHERERRRTRAECAELDVRDAPAADPQVRRVEADRCFDHGVRDAELAIELERARMHDERARRRCRGGSLVDEAHAHAGFREPQREHEAGRTGTRNQDVDVAHASCNREAFIVKMGMNRALRAMLNDPWRSLPNDARARSREMRGASPPPASPHSWPN